jgi:hypothetical protein
MTTSLTLTDASKTTAEGIEALLEIVEDRFR